MRSFEHLESDFHSFAASRNTNQGEREKAEGISVDVQSSGVQEMSEPEVRQLLWSARAGKTRLRLVVLLLGCSG